MNRRNFLAKAARSFAGLLGGWGILRSKGAASYYALTSSADEPESTPATCYIGDSTIHGETFITGPFSVFVNCSFHAERVDLGPYAYVISGDVYTESKKADLAHRMLENIRRKAHE